MLRPTALVLMLLTCVSAAPARRRAVAPAPGPVALTSVLPAGPLPVGFKMWLLRAQASEFTHGPQHLVQISVWYPAVANSGAPMTFRDYVVLKANENTYDEPSDAARAAAAAELTRDLPADAAQWWLDSPVVARRDATMPANNKFPLVYIAEGNNESAADEALLAEFLASHGYVVVTSPSITRLTGPLTSEENVGVRAEEQQDDIDRAASAIGDWPIAVNIPVSVIGRGLGADAALLYAMHHPTNALVLVDAELDTTAGTSLKSVPMWNGFALPPILFIYSNEPDLAFVRSLNTKELTIQQIGSMRDGDYTSRGVAAAAFPAIARALGAGPNVRRDVPDYAQRVLDFLDRIWAANRPH